MFEDNFNKKLSDLKCQYANSVSFLHLNIRSLPKNYSDFIAYINLLNLEFSITGFPETWLNSSKCKLYNLEGYKHEFIYRDIKSGGGVSLFIKDNISYQCQEDLDVLNECAEALFIEIDKQQMNKPKNIIVGLIYRPPNTNIVDFNSYISDLLMSIKCERKLIYLMGDFNITLLNSEKHLLTSEFLDIMYSFSFYPLINKPTRVGNETATLIDNIYCNDLEMYHMFNGILYTNISSHIFYKL